MDETEFLRYAQNDAPTQRRVRYGGSRVRQRPLTWAPAWRTVGGENRSVPLGKCTEPGRKEFGRVFAKGRWVCVVWLAAWVGLAGCAQSTKDVREVRLIPARPFEPDVPVPIGFKLVDKSSEDRSTGMGRLYLRHLYQGRADKYSIRNFYREQMPLARWSKISDGNVKGNIDMRFEKGSESCTVTIFETRGLFAAEARIQVIVAREEPGQSPPVAGKGS